jgi:hypothetical protein
MRNDGGRCGEGSCRRPPQHVEQDTLPAYQRLITDNPTYAREVIGSSVHDRIEMQRLEHRIDDIILDLATDWDVGVDW